MKLFAILTGFVAFVYAESCSECLDNCLSGNPIVFHYDGAQERLDSPEVTVSVAVVEPTGTVNSIDSEPNGVGSELYCRNLCFITCI
jgi:hypothetical protein